MVVFVPMSPTAAPRSRTLVGWVSVLGTILFALLVAGCSVLVPSPQIGRWELQTVDGVKAVFPARLVFTTSDVTIDTGCNTGAATYRLDGSKLTLEGAAFTKVACGEGALAIQDGAFRAMAAGATATFNGEVLTLDMGSGQPVLVFRRGAGS
jgi:heat shock protein HslJ